MYESYWGLSEKPFAGLADPRFYYPSESHQAALLKLKYAVEGGCGAALLAGGSGLGKTLLVRALLSQLGQTYWPRVQVVFPQMPPAELLAFIAGELVGKQPLNGVPPVQQSVHVLQQVLAKNREAKRRAIIVIDEAQVLSAAGGLETVRMLLNFDSTSQRSLCILLAGQVKLLSALERHAELDERLELKCLLRPLKIDETLAYVAHRLRTAGAQREIFDEPALEAVHHLGQGVPRRINRLCDLALLVGYAEGQTKLSAAQIESVSADLVTLAAE